MRRRPELAAADFAAIKSWKASAVRFPLSQANWLGRTCDATTYASLVDAAVTAANAAGLYAVLDLHWTDVQGRASCGSACASGQQPMPDPDSVTFWSQVAARYGKNPGVVFELFNEPHPNAMNGVVQPAEWACWRSGGCAVTASTDPSVTYTAIGMQALYDRVRRARLLLGDHRLATPLFPSPPPGRAKPNELDDLGLERPWLLRAAERPR